MKRWGLRLAPALQSQGSPVVLLSTGNAVHGAESVERFREKALPLAGINSALLNTEGVNEQRKAVYRTGDVLHYTSTLNGGTDNSITK